MQPSSVARTRCSVTLIDPSVEPEPEPEPATHLATTRLAALPVPVIERVGEGWHDYTAPMDPDLRLEQFSSGASKDLHAALEAINRAGAERLVFDLRGNPGGYVNEAVAVASEFLSTGTVYQERNAQGETKASDVKPGGIATKIPMASGGQPSQVVTPRKSGSGKP